MQRQSTEVLDSKGWDDAINQFRELKQQIQFFNEPSVEKAAPSASLQPQMNLLPAIERKSLSSARQETLEHFQQIDFENDCAKLRVYLQKLLNHCEDENKKQYLRDLLNYKKERILLKAELQKRSLVREPQDHELADLQRFHPLHEAIQLFLHLEDAEDRLEKLNNEVRKNTFLLKSEFIPPLNKQLETFRRAVFNSEIANANLALRQYDKELRDSNLRVSKMKKAHQFPYPDSYKNIGLFKTHSVKLHQAAPAPDSSSSQAINRVKALFDDYSQKNSICYFHWRHHEAIANRISEQLEQIEQTNDSMEIKVQKAIDLIFKEEDQLGRAKRLSLEDRKSSSFFRRAHYAIELLDAERVQMESKVKAHF